ncbi:hypothetical protein BaRGS_00004256, partial [Batillaria attramentaria]
MIRRQQVGGLAAFLVLNESRHVMILNNCTDANTLTPPPTILTPIRPPPNPITAPASLNTFRKPFFPKPNFPTTLVV